MNRAVTLDEQRQAARGVLSGWAEHAACRGRADVMDPQRTKINREYADRAIALCRRCPVLDDCRTWVMALPYSADPGGVCAGLTESDRARRRVTAKHCAACKKTLPGSEFHANRRQFDGLQPTCIACTRTLRHPERSNP